MMYPLVRDLAAKDAPLRVPITVACRVLGFSPQAFHKWVKNPVSDRDWGEAHLINAAFDAHADDPTFGYRLISDELAVQGFTASERRVWRLCSQQGLWSVFSKKKGKKRKPGPPVHDDLVKRNFTAARPNELWLTDITEHKTGEGKLYLCAIKDVCSNKIVGYSIDSRMKARLAVDALEMAVAHRGRPTGVVVHSDRGSPVQVAEVRARLGAPRAARFDGSSWRGRRQRGDGVILRAAAEERPQPAVLDHSGRAALGDHSLDRGDVSPPPPATPTRETHTGRV